MRVALVYDRLNKIGGAEKVFWLFTIYFRMPTGTRAFGIRLLLPFHGLGEFITFPFFTIIMNGSRFLCPLFSKPTIFLVMTW